VIFLRNEDVAPFVGDHKSEAKEVAASPVEAETLLNKVLDSVGRLIFRVIPSAPPDLFQRKAE
jgi:hypothetical protein